MRQRVGVLLGMFGLAGVLAGAAGGCAGGGAVDASSPPVAGEPGSDASAGLEQLASGESGPSLPAGDPAEQTAGVSEIDDEITRSAAMIDQIANGGLALEGTETGGELPQVDAGGDIRIGGSADGTPRESTGDTPRSGLRDLAGAGDLTGAGEPGKGPDEAQPAALPNVADINTNDGGLTSGLAALGGSDAVRAADSGAGSGSGDGSAVSGGGAPSSAGGEDSAAGPRGDDTSSAAGVYSAGSGWAPLDTAADAVVRLAGDAEVAAAEPVRAAVAAAAMRVAVEARAAAAAKEEPLPPRLMPAERQAVEEATKLLDALTGELVNKARGARAAVETLRDASSARIAVGRTALASRVGGFGDFDPLPTNRFQAGARNPMIVYVEMQNFRVRREDSAESVQFRVHTSLEVQVLDQDGVYVWGTGEQDWNRVSRSNIADHWQIAVIELPATLAAGRYSLKAVVRDRVNGSFAESSLPVTLVATSAGGAIPANRR